MRFKIFGIFFVVICMDLHNDHERCIITYCHSLHNDDHNVIIHFLTNKFVGAPCHITWGYIFLFTNKTINKVEEREGVILFFWIVWKLRISKIRIESKIYYALSFCILFFYPLLICLRFSCIFSKLGKDVLMLQDTCNLSLLILFQTWDRSIKRTYSKHILGVLNG
jgi:hypothetical protein